MDTAEVYIGGKTGGIPESFFSSPERGEIEIEGINGRLKGIKRDRFIKIYDPNNPLLFFFEARFNDNNTISFDIRNMAEDDRNKKNPDIHIKLFAMHSVKYFTDQGLIVDGISSTWARSEGINDISDIYDQFMQYINTLGREPTDEDKIEAAKHTWTWALAQSLGFTEITVPRILKHTPSYGKTTTYIFTTFKKPGTELPLDPKLG